VPRDREHFLALAARAMRQVLVSYARERAAAKRGGPARPVTLEEDRVAARDRSEWLIDVDRALARLAARDERLARVVECRFFAGLTEEETAESLGSSVRTVQRDWMRARAWLREELGGDAP
jgi:RNA polymerase sigma factor (TIGR02999 family)